MKRLFCRGLMAAAGIVALLAAAPTQAQVPNPYGLASSVPTSFAMATAGQWTGNGIGVFGDNRVLHATNKEEELTNGPSASADVINFSPSPGNTGTARSFANFGTIRVYAEIDDNNPDVTQPHPTAIAHAGWIDRITVSHAALNGQAGTLTFSLFVDGFLNASDPRGSAFMQVGAIGESQASADFDTWGGQANQVPGDFDLVVSQTVTYSLPFTFGTPFAFMVGGLASANLSSINPPTPGSDALADFYNTVNWNGIQSVTAGGNPVSGYTVVSQSGTDYTQSFAAAAAPETGTLSLLGGALCGVLAASRFRRKRTAVQR